MQREILSTSSLYRSLVNNDWHWIRNWRLTAFAQTTWKKSFFFSSRFDHRTMEKKKKKRVQLNGSDNWAGAIGEQIVAEARLAEKTLCALLFLLFYSLFFNFLLRFYCICPSIGNMC